MVKNNNKWNLVSLGIGSLTSSRFSRHQFAFLLCLIDAFPENFKPTIIYDPEFNKEDKELIVRFLPTCQIIDFSPNKKNMDLTFIYAPHLPHEVIESTFEKIGEKSIWITNDFNQMKLATETQIQEYGENIRRIIHDESGFEIEEFDNSWADEPGAFNSLCYLHQLT